MIEELIKLTPYIIDNTLTPYHQIWAFSKNFACRLWILQEDFKEFVINYDNFGSGVEINMQIIKKINKEVFLLYFKRKSSSEGFKPSERNSEIKNKLLGKVIALGQKLFWTGNIEEEAKSKLGYAEQRLFSSKWTISPSKVPIEDKTIQNFKDSGPLNENSFGFSQLELSSSVEKSNIETDFTIQTPRFSPTQSADLNTSINPSKSLNEEDKAQHPEKTDKFSWLPSTIVPDSQAVNSIKAPQIKRPPPSLLNQSAQPLNSFPVIKTENLIIMEPISVPPPVISQGFNETPGNDDGLRASQDSLNKRPENKAVPEEIKKLENMPSQMTFNSKTTNNPKQPDLNELNKLHDRQASLDKVEAPDVIPYTSFGDSIKREEIKMESIIKTNPVPSNPFISQEKPQEKLDSDKKEESKSEIRLIKAPVRAPQSYFQSLPIQSLNQNPPIQSLNQSIPVQSLNQSPPVQSLNQSMPIQPINHNHLPQAENNGPMRINPEELNAGSKLLQGTPFNIKNSIPQFFQIPDRLSLNAKLNQVSKNQDPPSPGSDQSISDNPPEIEPEFTCPDCRIFEEDPFTHLSCGCFNCSECIQLSFIENKCKKCKKHLNPEELSEISQLIQLNIV